MARVANLDKNPRVAKFISVTGEKYKHYEVELNGKFYRKVYRDTIMGRYEKGEARINVLRGEIERLNAKNSDDHLVPIPCTIGASTLTDAHAEINKFLTLEGWHQYRAGVIASIEEQIKKEQEDLDREAKENRGEASYRFDSGTFQELITAGEGNRIFGKEDWEIIGATTNKVKDIAETPVNVAEWKEKQIARLKATLDKLNTNIAKVEAINVDEAQKWYDDMRIQAQDYIDGKVNVEEA